MMNLNLNGKEDIAARSTCSLGSSISGTRNPGSLLFFSNKIPGIEKALTPGLRYGKFSYSFKYFHETIFILKMLFIKHRYKQKMRKRDL